jgi:protein TonB
MKLKKSLIADFQLKKICFLKIMVIVGFLFVYMDFQTIEAQTIKNIVRQDTVKYIDTIKQYKDTIEIIKIIETMEIWESYSTIVWESEPEYPGGEYAMWKFISKNLQYYQKGFPCEADYVSLVIVGVVIELDGSMTDLEIVKNGIHPALDSEALRVVKLMPKWKPGIREGKQSPVKINIPITFNLNKDNK